MYIYLHILVNIYIYLNKQLHSTGAHMNIADYKLHRLYYCYMLYPFSFIISDMCTVVISMNTRQAMEVNVTMRRFRATIVEEQQ